MPIPSNKKELEDAIQVSFNLLLKELNEIPTALYFEESMPGHAKDTMMSLHNLLSYLVGWGDQVLVWIEQDQKGNEIHFPHPDFKWTELGLLAQQFYKDYQEIPFPKLLNNLNLIVKKILQVIDNYSNEILYNRPFYKHYPLGRMIQLNTSSPYKNARKRIRKWKKENL